VDFVAYARRVLRERRCAEADQGDNAPARRGAASCRIDATDAGGKRWSGKGRATTAAAAGRAAACGCQRDRVGDSADVAQGTNPQGAAGTTTGCAGGAAAAARACARQTGGRVHPSLQLDDGKSGERSTQTCGAHSATACGSVRATTCAARAAASGNTAGQR